MLCGESPITVTETAEIEEPLKVALLPASSETPSGLAFVMPPASLHSNSGLPGQVVPVKQIIFNVLVHFQHLY